MSASVKATLLVETGLPWILWTSQHVHLIDHGRDDDGPFVHARKKGARRATAESWRGSMAILRDWIDLALLHVEPALPKNLDMRPAALAKTHKRAWLATDGRITDRINTDPVCLIADYRDADRMLERIYPRVNT